MRRAVWAALAVVVAVGGACSGGGGDEAATSTTSTTTPARLPAIELDVARAELVSPAAVTRPLPASVRDDVVEVVERFLHVTSAMPLATGRPGPGFADLVAADAGARAAGADRAAVFDEGLPTSRRVRATEARVGLSALADSGDVPALVVANVVWDVRSTRPDGRLVASVRRTGELTLVPAGPSRRWVVSAYDLEVRRQVGDAAATTTTGAGS